MTWNTLWPQDRKPTPGDIAEFVDNPLWKTLCSWLESGYRTVPRIEYSRCGMAPGWNVKYTKGGRALCTLYPAAGSFTCLVSRPGCSVVKWTGGFVGRSRTRMSGGRGE